MSKVKFKVISVSQAKVSIFQAISVSQVKGSIPSKNKLFCYLQVSCSLVVVGPVSMAGRKRK